MRKAVLYGVVLVCVCLLFALSGPYAQRIVNGDPGGGISPAPAPVAVANFPQVQPVQVDKTVNVTGSVAVTNLPAVQQVAGAVSVGNLPVDANGDLRIAAPAKQPAVHFIGFTPAIQVGFDVMSMSQECAADFPGTRACTVDELFHSIPPPPDWEGDRAGVILTLDSPSRCVNRSFQQGCADGGFIPVACCGY